MAGRFSYALDRAGPTERSRMENYINHIFNMDCIAEISRIPDHMIFVMSNIHSRTFFSFFSRRFPNFLFFFCDCLKLSLLDVMVCCLKLKIMTCVASFFLKSTI